MVLVVVLWFLCCSFCVVVVVVMAVVVLVVCWWFWLVLVDSSVVRCRYRYHGRVCSACGQCGCLGNGLRARLTSGNNMVHPA